MTATIKLAQAPDMYHTFNSQAEWDDYKRSLHNGTPRRQPLSEPQSFPCIWIIESYSFYNPDGADYVIGAFLYGTIEY